MAYRCKSCGYRFKSSDSDLCPECFTARDDIARGSFPGGADGLPNVHFKDSGSGDDFIAKQMREESRRSGDELSEEISRITDGIKRGFSSGEVPPNTYQQNAAPPKVFYSSQQQNGSYGSTPPPRLSRGYAQQQTGEQMWENMQRQQFEQSKIDSSKKRASCGCGCLIGIFLMIALPTLIGYFIDLSEKSENEAPQNVVIQTEVQMSSPEEADETDSAESNDETNMTSGRINKYTFYRDYLGSVEAGSEFQHSLHAEDPVVESVWHLIKCDIIADDEGISLEKTELKGWDSNGGELFFWSTQDPMYGSGNKLRGVPLCFPTAARYEVTVYGRTRDGEEKIMRFEPPLNFLYEEMDTAEAKPEPEAYKFNYDYDPAKFNSSLDDLNESGCMLLLDQQPYEIMDFEDSGRVTLEDETLTPKDMRLCLVNIAKKNGGAAVKIDLGSIKLCALDADGAPVYYCEAPDFPFLTLCDRVKDYELFVTVSEQTGFDRELHFRFTSNDLYNSINK